MDDKDMVGKLLKQRKKGKSKPDSYGARKKGRPDFMRAALKRGGANRRYM